MGAQAVLVIWLALGVTISQVDASKLNVPRVLLPYSSQPPTFQLVAESGCYKWSSTRPSVAKVTADNSLGCSSSAVIQGVGVSGSKSSAMVMAEDTGTGLLLRADVIVDSITELRIVTKTHELYLEETPEKFEVRAYDEQGNEFSTLKGLKFRWTIASSGAAKTEILRFMSWRASPYNTEPILEELEGQGSQGNKVLLEGVKTGSAKVSVRLGEPRYSSVPAATEPLLVVANLFLLPPVAHLLPCGALPYSASQFRANRLLPVPLPSPHHHLQLPGELGSVQEGTALLTAARTPGSGLLQLLDQNVEPGEEVKTPSAEVHIVLPARLELSCLPHKSWTVTVAAEVAIQVEMFDAEGNRIYPSDNVEIELSVEDEKFKVTSSLTNGTLLTGLPLLPGTARVTAVLLGVQGCPLSSPLTSSALLSIHPSLSLAPALTLLPWHPEATSATTVTHELEGGEAPFTWGTSNTNLSSINQRGVSTVQGSVLGSSLVTVAMSRAPHCQASAEIRVLPASLLSLMESEQEFPCSSSMAIPLLLAASPDLPFSSCASLPITATHSSPTFSSLLLPPSSPSHCATVEVSSPSPSWSSLEVAWTYPGQEGEVKLAASVTVASYSPLLPHSPISGDTVVAEGSSREVAWQGGPLPWPLLPSSHRREVVVADPSLLSLTPLPHPSLHRYSLTCLARGDTTITLTVGNSPSPSLPRPVTTSSSITVSCSLPHSISLHPLIARPLDTSLPPCPLAASQGRMATQSYLPLTLEVVITDSQGRRLDSVDTVAVTWALSSPALASLAVQGKVLVEEEVRDGVRQPGMSTQVLTPSGPLGPVDVTATIPREGGLLGKSSHSSTALLELVEDALLAPSSIALFELESGTSTTQGGSGHFHLLQPQGRLEASYSSRTVSLSPLGPGVAEVTLADLCLSHRRQGATAALTVSGLAKLILTVADKVEVGSAVTATVSLLDSSGQSLPPSALPHISLQLSSDLDLLTVGGQTATRFPVAGSHLGLASLTATASYSGVTVSSAPSAVTVYPPLALSPPNISLIIGASFQFLATGGPADCTVVWSVADLDIAGSNTEGVVTAAALGSTVVTARAVGREGEVYSSDTVTVAVRILSALRLKAPSRRVLQGALVPLTLYGQDSAMSVYSYGSASPLLNMDWGVAGAGSVRDLESALAPTGHSLISDNSGVVVFRATALGKTTVSCTVSVSQELGRQGQHQLDRDRALTASATITVVDRLELLNVQPAIKAGGVLLAQDSSYQLRVNKAAVFATNSKIVTVTEGGLVKSGGTLGSAVVTASYREGEREEEVAVSVEVREVAYLLARGAGQGWQGEGLETLPRGTNTGISVSQHDAWGRVFHSSSQAELAYRPSRFDLLKVSASPNSGSSSVLEARAAAKGWTVVRLEGGGGEAWLVARVGEGLAGSSSLGVGDVIQFTSPLVSGGVWSSSPSGLLSLDPTSGLVVAMAPGQARIEYRSGQDGGAVLSKVVTVAREQGVSLRSSSSLLLTSEQETVVPLLLGAARSNLLSGLGEGLGQPLAPFTCGAAWQEEQPIEKVWKVSAVLQSQGWACVFTPTGVLGPKEPVSVALTVRGQTIALQYIPGMALLQDRIEVGLSSSAVVKVLGHPSVLAELHVKHSEGVSVGVLSLADSELSLPVQLTSPHYSTTPTVTFTLPTTGQSVTASLLPLLSSCPAQREVGILTAILNTGLHYWQSVLLLILVAVLTIWITVKSLKPPAATPAPAPAPATPKQQPEEVGGTYLWTQDKSPIYGSPIFRRSPPSGARNLTQYSYN